MPNRNLTINSSLKAQPSWSSSDQSEYRLEKEEGDAEKKPYNDLDQTATQQGFDEDNLTA